MINNNQVIRHHSTLSAVTQSGGVLDDAVFTVFFNISATRVGKWFMKLSLPNSIKQKSSFATSLTATAFLDRNGMNLYMDEQFMQGNDSLTVSIVCQNTCNLIV